MLISSAVRRDIISNLLVGIVQLKNVNVHVYIYIYSKLKSKIYFVTFLHVCVQSRFIQCLLWSRRLLYSRFISLVNNKDNINEPLYWLFSNAIPTHLRVKRKIGNIDSACCLKCYWFKITDHAFVINNDIRNTRRIISTSGFFIGEKIRNPHWRRWKPN